MSHTKPGMSYSTICLLLLLITGISFTGYANDKNYISGSIKGRVVDTKSGQPVENALVSILETTIKDTTDSIGFFIFPSVNVGLLDIQIAAKGYKTQLFPSISIISGTNEPLVLEIQKDNIQELEKMVVTSSTILQKRAEQSTSVTRLTRDEVLNSPGSLDDINRVLQTHAAAIGTGDDMYNDFMVRGGNDNENIFLIDDIEVNNLSHWGSEYGSGGAISTLHPGFIRDIDFYAGGFPATYPPRLSSISDIHFREGSKSDRKYQIDMNMAGFGTFLEGPIVKNKASYMVNARLSVLDLMDTFLDLEGLPKYQNGQAKFVYDINQKNSLILNLLAGNERIDLESENVEEDNWRWEEEGKRAIGGLQWRRQSDNYKNKLLFSGIYHRYNGYGIQDDSIYYEKLRSQRERFQLKDNLSIFVRENDVLNIGASIDREKFYDRLSADAYYVFADILGDSIFYYYKGIPDTSVVQENYRIFDSEYEDTSLINYRISGYLGYALFLNRFKINLGLRNDYFTLVEKNGLSPRFAVSYNAGPAGTFALSSGLYYQYPAYVNGLYKTANIDSYDLQRNMQAVVGYEKELNDAVVVGAETYYKYYDREPNFVIEDGRREISSKKDNYGKKQVYGLEVFLHKKRIDYFYYQLSYTFFNSKQKYANGKWYVDDNNLRNSANIILGSNFNKSNSILVRLDVTEGYPYTPIDYQSSNNTLQTTHSIDDGWNSRRRNTRIKLSLRYNLKLYYKKVNVTAYIEAQNILNQRDVVQEWYARGAKFGQGYIDQYLSRGIFPVGGLTIEF